MRFKICLSMIFTFFLLQSSTLLKAQEISIKGKVINENTQEIVRDVYVKLFPQNDTTKYVFTVSDSLGNFAFFNLSSNLMYVIECSAVDFAPHFQLLNTTNLQNPQIELTILLSQRVDTLEQAVVRRRVQAIRLDGNKMIVDADKMVGAKASSIFEMLKQIPGVTIDANENISLNGQSDIIITINGRKRTMSVQQAVKILKSMPASTVKAVEISQGKSAADDAAGNGGTINIVTNQLKQDGYNLDFYNAIITDRYVSNTNYLLFNYRKNKYSVFANLGGSRDVAYYTNTALTEYINQNSNNFTTDDHTKINQKSKDIYFDLSIDYEINKNNVISTFTNLYWGNKNRLGDLNSLVNNDSPYKTINVSDEFGRDHLKTFGVLHTFQTDSSKFKIKTDISYLDGFDKSNIHFLNKYLNSSDQLLFDPITLLGDLRLKGHQYILQSDIEWKLTKKFRIESGLKHTNGRIGNLSQYDTLRMNQLWNDPTRTNDFDYKEKISAAYITLKGNIHKKLSYQTGLRLEHTSMLTASEIYSNSTEKKFTNLFPSASISYNAGNIITSINYSNSITRPYYGYINGIERYINEFTYQIGNPQLGPAISQNFSISNNILQFINLNLGYYHVQDNLLLYRERIPNTTLTKIQPVNGFDYNAFYGLLNASYQLLEEKWEGSVNFYYFTYKSKLKEGLLFTDFDHRRLGRFLISTSQSYKISPALQVEASYTYHSANKVNQVEIKSRQQLNMGMRYKLIKDKMNMNILVTDIFNQMHENRIRYYNSVYNETNSIYNSQRVTVSFSITLGKLKGSFEKNTSSDTEKNRFKEN